MPAIVGQALQRPECPMIKGSEAMADLGCHSPLLGWTYNGTRNTTKGECGNDYVFVEKIMQGSRVSNLEMLCQPVYQPTPVGATAPQTSVDVMHILNSHW
jgi:hypothetical protein